MDSLNQQEKIQNKEKKEDQQPQALLTASRIKREKEPPESTDEGQLTLDIFQTENELVIKSTIAGVSPEDLDISITDDMVTIKGERKRDEEVPQENYFYQELYWGPFSRSVILPTEIDVDNSTATLKNGILTIRLPKLEKSKIRKIKVS